MSRQTDVILDAEADALMARQYHWDPFPNTTGMDAWARNAIAVGAVGATGAASICCFDYTMLVAARRGYLSRAQLNGVYHSMIVGGRHDAGVMSYWGYRLSVWRDWSGVPFSYWRPSRGDLVFFSSPIGGDYAHVALACGSNNFAGHAQVISFGEGMAAPGPCPVRRTTIEAIRLLYGAAVTTVKFTTPLWA
jgi:hypothetical protein